jgi:hypothetical protein
MSKIQIVLLVLGVSLIYPLVSFSRLLEGPRPRSNSAGSPHYAAIARSSKVTDTAEGRKLIEDIQRLANKKQGGIDSAQKHAEELAKSARMEARRAISAKERQRDLDAARSFEMAREHLSNPPRGVAAPDRSPRAPRSRF